MARPSSRDPIDPMDLMRQNGVRSLEITCHQCRHKVVMNVDHLPGDLTVKSFEPRMVCTKCGTIGADVRPMAREKAVRVDSAGRLQRSGPSSSRRQTIRPASLFVIASDSALPVIAAICAMSASILAGDISSRLSAAVWLSR
jgi:hypothetical protein